MSRGAIAVVALALAACTTTVDPVSSPTATAPAPAPSTPAATPPDTTDARGGDRVVEVAMAEWAVTLSGGSLDGNRIQRGRVTFRISNPGTVTHGFKIKKEGPNRGSGGSDTEQRTRTLAPGESVELTVRLTVGEWEIECYVADHDERGMRATLRVVEHPVASVPCCKPLPGAARIENFAFDPDPVKIGAGSPLTWINDDPTEHTVTGDDFDSGVLGPDERFTHTFGSPGSYTYLCSIHPSMTGTVRVT